MATKIVKEYSAFYEGIADFPKTGGPASYQLGRSVDHRTDTRSIQLLPKTIKKSSAVITDLIKWATTSPYSPYDTFLYGNTGNFYTRTAAINYSLNFHAPVSHGNGVEYFAVDNWVYFATDTNLMRYGPIQGTQTFGTPTPDISFLTHTDGNQYQPTYFAFLQSASSQYMLANSTSSISPSGSITIKFSMIGGVAPSLGNTKTILSKWDESGAKRSYIVDLLGIAGGVNVRLRLGISDDGTSTEYYTTDIALTAIALNNLWAITWNASTSTAKFYKTSSLIATVVGAKTSINVNTTPFMIGTNKDGGGLFANFFDGGINDVSLSSGVQGGVFPAITSVFNWWSSVLGYWPMEHSTDDISVNANTLSTPNGISYISYVGTTNRLDVDQSGGSVAQTYAVGTTLSSLAADTLTFTPTKSPQIGFAVQVQTIGTGTLTIAIHDSNNVTVATKTIPNNAMLIGAITEFVFDTPWYPALGATYTAHIYSSVADTVIYSTTLNDFSTGLYATFFALLFNDTQYHPVKQFQDFMVIGNGAFLAKWDGVTYNPNELVLDPGWKVRCLGYWNEYLAIGAWKGDTVDQFDQGRIFFWDGAIPFGYNFFIDVPEGAINAMVGSKGQLWFIAGPRCKLMVYEGGARANKIKNLVNSDNENTIDVYPGAMNMWRLLLRFGVAGSNADTIIQEGVYTWGTVNERFPESLSFDYVISTGHYQGTTVKIGCVQAALGKLLIGWQDASTYGVDEVDVANDPFATGTVQFLIEDDGAMYHQKEAITVTTQFEPLTSGQSLTLKYRFDRNASFTSLPAITTVGQTTSRDVIATGVKRYREYEVGLDLATSSSSSPIVLAVGIEKDVLETEKRVG